MLPELDWGLAIEARVRANGIVVLSPRFDDHLGLATRSEPLEAQALVAEVAVGSLVGITLPRVAWVDQRGLNSPSDPVVALGIESYRCR